MRNLTKTITAISLLAPVSAFPLGIGDIKLHSALNQNLDAEIALFVSAGENVSDINVKLAPPEKFDEAGVPWNYFLSKIKFQTIKAADGSTIIKVSSKEALREPFLDFLVEVSWDKGNLYREFTVLVDPPVAYTQAVIPVVQKPNEVVEAKPAKNTTIAKVNTQKSKKIVKDTFSNGEYGPTRRNDSLWKVADKTNTYSDVTRAQMMMAIFKANPNAFYKDNVNALEAGKTLKIPEKEVILSLSKDDAQLAFKAQTDQWTGVVNTNLQANLDKTKGIHAQVELTAPTEEQVADTTVVVSQNDANVDPQSNGTKVKQTDLPSLSSEDSFAMQAKMEKLEQQLAMVQKMLVLKDEQIAALQNQNKVKNTSEIEVKQAEGSDKKIEPKEEPVTTAKDTEPVVKEAPIVNDQVKDEDTKVETESVSPEKETLSTPMLSAIVFPILGLLGWALWRKGREEDEDAIDDDSIFASASEIIPLDSLGDEEESDSSSDKMPSLEDPLEDSSFLNEFSSSDFHTFDKDLSEDVDPVLEADVYLAYGRYQQAEELMRQAIVDQPERDECKLKLLEIFHAHENKSGFEKYVIELEKSGKNKDQSFWSKVVEMGDELDVKSSSGENIVTKNDIDDDSDSNTNKITEEETLEGNKNEMEFDLSIFDEDEKDQKLEKENSNEDDANNIDFDLSEFQVNDSNSTDGGKDSKITEEFETFDFDFDKLSEKDSEQGVLDLTDMDEMETKIDLAKAYIDMGDYDAAKAIAQEAFEKGNDEQKLAAQDILDLLD
ncbi:MAG: FimV/HubP family polar landmark protein [Methylococcaceae bacterium]